MAKLRSSVGFVLLLSLFAEVVHGQTCTATDGNALQYFCREIVYSRTEFSTWNDGTNCCNWAGVTCNGGGSVQALNITNADIVVPFPQGSPYLIGTGLGDLTAMVSLAFVNIPFNGGLPPAWGKGLPNLKVLILDGCNVAGPLPQEFCSLTQLTTLILRGNLMTGNVPSCFSNPKATFPNLVTMDLSGNSFSGAVPSYP